MKTEPTIDLRKCKAGVKLVSVHGSVLTYVGPMPQGSPYPHAVVYEDGRVGSRLHDGHVYKNLRLAADEDISLALSNQQEADLCKNPSLANVFATGKGQFRKLSAENPCEKCGIPTKYAINSWDRWAPWCGCKVKGS